LVILTQTSVARAWDFKKPFVVAPAMNTMMWEHPFTEKHIQTLTSLGLVIIPPISKLLACKDSGAFNSCVFPFLFLTRSIFFTFVVGVGAMEEPENIAKVVKTILLTKQP
jgi:phosphopantothenoylcysteine synthetase/decarboxylase